MCPAPDYSHMDFSNSKKIDYTTLLISLAKYKFVKSILSGNESVLDVGCGMGYGVHYLSKFCKEITGIDNDPEQIMNAKETYSSVNMAFHCIDIIKDPEIIRNKDIIVCFEVVQDMTRETAFEFLKTISDYKDPNSVFFLSTPRKLPEDQLTESRTKYHPHEYTYDELHYDLNRIFKRTLMMGQLDEFIGSLHKNNVWTFYCICF
jgi:2-polyprenyl-3-methyl-5-hydroxy-6-metoxy-1,4-benzoquinol methylase